MGYQLGIDLGTTYTAAAIARAGRVEICSLGTAAASIPSVILLRADGELLVGEVAVRRGMEEPTRVAREFKRRLGDPTPLVLGGTPYGAEALTGQLLRAVVRMVSEREGSAPDQVVLTHPANYGPYKLDMMREVARLAGLDLATTTFITEPQAAAVSYAQRNRVEPGDVVAVYDFGGGTFDAALLQRRDDGFTLLGRPEGMERFGGIDIDAAILNHIDQSLDGAVRALDPDDPVVIAAVSRLRDECRDAKEALAADTDTSIAVSLPTKQTSVRLTRRELEDMVRPRLAETFEALDRAVRSAGLTMDQVSRILLVGGSSRMPLVAEMLQRASGRPIAVDAHPKYAIALGAAAFGAEGTMAASAAATPPVVTAPPVATPPPVAPAVVVPAVVATSPTAVASAPDAAAVTAEMPGTAPRPPAPPPFSATAPVAPPAGGRGKAVGLFVAGVVVVAAVIGGVMVLNKDDDSAAAPTTTAESVDSVVSTSVAPAVAVTTLVVAPVDTTIAPDPTTPASVAATETTVAPTTAPVITTPDPAAQATAQLLARVVEDRALADSLVGTFVPQLSAKFVGLELDGVVFGPVEVLDDHETLRSAHGAILVDAGAYQFTTAGGPMTGWFLTIVPVAFATKDEASAWCTDQGLGIDLCFGREFKPKN